MAAKKKYSFFGKMHYRFWRYYNIFNKGMQVESESQIKCVYYSSKLFTFLLRNTSLLTYFNSEEQQT